MKTNSPIDSPLIEPSTELVDTTCLGPIDVSSSKLSSNKCLGPLAPPPFVTLCKPKKVHVCHKFAQNTLISIGPELN